MSESLQDITAVIVAYNSAHVIHRCLTGLRGVSRVLVVDNQSSDATVSRVCETMPQAEILRAGANLGFGRGANLGLERVRTEFALVINPDCIATESALGLLLAAAARYEDAALLAPQLINGQGRLESGFKTPLRDVTQRDPPYVRPAGDVCSPCLTGAVYLLRMPLLRRVGFFEPAIFLFYEDDDLCLRIRRAGYSCILVPSATMEHAVGQSSPPTFYNRLRREYHFKRSHLFVIGKYDGAVARRMRALHSIGYAVPRLIFPSIFNHKLFARCLGMLIASVRDILGFGLYPRADEPRQ